MKKLLALVLALVMTLGLATVGSNAAYGEFKDADKIGADYTEAVTVMNALGVFIGDENGFRPQDTLTRAEGAKIAAYFVTNQNTADGMVGSGKFTDVPATNWAAGYIELCQSLKILAGVGDNKFDPQGKLTAAAFAKMMAVALGYDPTAEGFYSDTWALRAMTIANREGLLAGLDGIKASDSLTREQAAQMAFNTVKTPLVTAAVGTQIKVNDAIVEVGATAPKYETTTRATEQTISKAKETNTDNYFVEYGERYFTGLKLDETTFNAFGQPTHTWSIMKDGKYEIIGAYTDKPTLFYSTSTKISKIYSDLGMTKSAPTEEFMIDGKLQDNFDVTKTGSWLSGTGKGVAQYVYVDYDKSGEPIIKIYEINTFVANVSRFKNETVTISPLTDHDYNFSSRDFSTKETFAEDDIVSFTAAYNTNSKKYVLQSVDKLEVSDSGVITKWTGSKVTEPGTVGDSSAFTANGTDYGYSKYSWVNPDNDITKFVAGKTNVNVYLDAYGYCLYLDGTAEPLNYAAVIGLGGVNTHGNQVTGATLLLADGSIKAVTAKQTQDNTKTLKQYLGYAENVNDNMVGTTATAALVTYTVGDDGVYNLKLAGTNAKYIDTSLSKTEEFTSGQSSIKLWTSDTAAQASNLYTTEKTVFFVAEKGTSGNYGYKVYTGYKAMPSLVKETKTTPAVATPGATVGTAWAVNGKYSTQVDAVYIAADQLGTVKTAEIIFVKGEGDTRATEKGAKTQIDYYTLPAIVNGEETEVKVSTGVLVDGQEHAAFTGNATAGVWAVNSVVKNSDDIITSFVDVTGFVFGVANTKTGVVGATTRDGRVVLGVGGNGSLTTGVTYYAFDNKTVAFAVDEDYTEIKLSKVASVVTDANDVIYAGVDEDTNVLTYVVVVDQPDSGATVAGLTSVVVKNVKDFDYSNAQFYTEDSHVISYTEAREALIAQMVKDGIDKSTISFNGRTVSFKVGSDGRSALISAFYDGNYTNIRPSYQVYKVTYKDLTTGESTVAYLPDGSNSTAIRNALRAVDAGTSFTTSKTVAVEKDGKFVDVSAYYVTPSLGTPDQYGEDVVLTYTGKTDTGDVIEALLTKNGKVTLGADTIVNNLTVPAGSTLAIAPAMELTVTGKLTVKGTVSAGSSDNVTITANAQDTTVDGGKINIPNGTMDLAGRKIILKNGATAVAANITAADLVAGCDVTVKNLTLSGNLILVGDEKSTVTVTGALALTGNIYLGYEADMTANSDAKATTLTLPEGTDEDGNIYVNGNATIENANDLTGNVTFENGAALNLAPVEDGTTTISGAITLNGNAKVNTVGKGDVKVTSSAMTPNGHKLTLDAATTEANTDANGDSTLNDGIKTGVTTTTVEEEAVKKTKVEIAIEKCQWSRNNSTSEYVVAGDTVTITFSGAVKSATGSDVTTSVSGATLTVKFNEDGETFDHGMTVVKVVSKVSDETTQEPVTYDLVFYRWYGEEPQLYIDEGI